MAPIKKESPINNEAFQYVIGIDFGTTFSGAGYMYIKNADRKEVIDIKKWPKNSANLNLKIPTVIRYNKTDRKIYKCGLEAIKLSKSKEHEYDECITLFKLHLSERAREEADSLPEDLSVLTVISDYLRYLHENICLDMQEALGGGAAFEKRKNTFRYCLTVPAIWTDEAKSTMREASILAGIIHRDDHVDRLLMVGEPEAAALYAEQMRGGISIKSGETLMIVDAGGGTIDLTTFEKTIDGETKSFKEIVEGNGNAWGSSQLDKNFRIFIEKMMSDYFKPDKSSLDQLVEKFQKNVKLCIGDETDEDCVYISLPSALYGRTIERDNMFIMDVDTLSIPLRLIETEVFDPVIEKILNMIKSQLESLEERTLDYIILVGGFGQSSYLLKRIKDRFNSEVGDIIVPDVRELAVARGAVYFGLDPYSISHRRMRFSYGIAISSEFIEGVDREDYKIFDKNGIAYCKNRFDPIVSKGQDVSIKDCISRAYSTQNSETFCIKLYSFSGESTPRYVSINDDRSEGTAYKVAEFIMQLPSSHTQETSFNMDMYFGHMEIKIEVTVDGSQETSIFTASY